MRNAARLILGFYPLPLSEAARLRNFLRFPRGEFSAVDPCVGDGAAFQKLFERTQSILYGIELDALRTEQARQRNIAVLQGDALETRCPVESCSVLYLNPPYDFEIGCSGNRRFEEVFLHHTYRWLKRQGVLIFVIPQRQLERCSSLLAEHFTDIRVYRLTAPESVRYHQIVVFATRRNARQNLNDQQLRATATHLTALSGSGDLPVLPDKPDARYSIPPSDPVQLSYRGLRWDEVEDVLLQSSAYQQARRLLVRQPMIVRGRPVTQLHGGHVALLAASGALNGVFGSGDERHMANWSPARMYHHAHQEEEDGTIINRKWSSFSPMLLLLYENGVTRVLEHRKAKKQAEDDGQHEIPRHETSPIAATVKSENTQPKSGKTRRTPRRRIRLT